MKTIVLILLFALSLSAFANEIHCPSVKSKGEVHWPIPSEGFSLERYKEAIDYLNQIVEVNAEGRDYFNVENELMYIKGFMLKLHDEKEAFCEFIKNEAYVRH
jgi:hypothetical protein